MTARKSLETRREEMRAARLEVVGIYQPLLDAWHQGISSNELDRRIADAAERAERPLRRFRRLKTIVSQLETHAIEGDPTP